MPEETGMPEASSTDEHPNATGTGGDRPATRRSPPRRPVPPVPPILSDRPTPGGTGDGVDTDDSLEPSPKKP